MVYAKKSDMEARFRSIHLVELTNPDNHAATAIDDAKLTVALNDASAEIDAILGERFSLPFASPPAVLVTVCCDIARYRLYANRSTEEVETRYNNARKLLREMAAGKVGLGTAPVSAGGVPVYKKPTPVFNAGKLFS